MGIPCPAIALGNLDYLGMVTECSALWFDEDELYLSHTNGWFVRNILVVHTSQKPLKRDQGGFS